MHLSAAQISVSSQAHQQDKQETSQNKPDLAFRHKSTQYISAILVVSVTACQTGQRRRRASQTTCRFADVRNNQSALNYEPLKCGDDHKHNGASGVLVDFVTQYSEPCTCGPPTATIKAAKLIPAAKLWKPLDIMKIELYTVT